MEYITGSCQLLALNVIFSVKITNAKEALAK